MIKKALTICAFALLLFCSFIPFNRIKAQDCSSESECRKLIDEYESKLTGIRAQKNTLSSQIQYFDTQIYIATTKIRETELKIQQTEEEINNLGQKIDGLNTSLDYLGKVLIKKIAESYKKKQATIIDLIVDSNNAMSLSNQLKYIQISQDNDRRIAFQVQTAKNNFEEQKALREKKKIELADLKITLDSQKIALNSQKADKQKLLDATNSDENTYQGLLEKAQAELSGFSAFVQSAGGGGLTSFGNGSNGWYFTQRDPAWGNICLPGSSSTMAYAGCAVTSVAMVCKSFGQNMTPASIVGSSSYFVGGDLWNWAFGCNGRSSSGPVYMSKDTVKSYINDKNAKVILRLVSPSVSGLHFVVGWKFDGDELIIHDPYYGPDMKFSSKYSWGQVTTAIAIY